MGFDHMTSRSDVTVTITMSSTSRGSRFCFFFPWMLPSLHVLNVCISTVSIKTSGCKSTLPALFSAYPSPSISGKLNSRKIQTRTPKRRHSARFSIWVRGFLLNFGVYYATRAALGLTFEWSSPVAFITVFVTLFALVIAISKDLPDVWGDRK